MARRRRRKPKPRWRKWLLISTISLGVLLGAGYIGLELAVDYVLRSFLSGGETDEQVQALLAGDLDAIFDGGSDGHDLPSGGVHTGETAVNVGLAPTNDGQAAGGAAATGDGSGRAGEGGAAADANSGQAAAEGTVSPLPADRTRGTEAGVPPSSAGEPATSSSGNSSSQPAGDRELSRPTSGGGAVASSPGEAGQSIEPRPAATGQVEGAPAASDDPLSYTPEVTKEKAAAVQESITLGEKLKVAGVLMKRLDASDIDLFMKMMSGGMTVEEKRAAKDIMLERLTAEEYDELIQIAAKYGLSRGKSYEESLLE